MAAEAKSHSVVQVGMQRRSYDLYLEGRKLVAAGTLGSVRMVRSWWLNNSLGDAEPPQLQGALDWDQWQGPARRKPRDPRRFFHWRLYSEYAGGIMADQGAHTFDGIHLLMDAGFPLWVTAAAGRPHQADGDTPESVVVTAGYPDDFLASFAINYAAMHYQTRNDQLTQLDGDRARMDVAREELKVYAQGAEETPTVARASAKGFGAATTRHIANFLECVRTRQRPAAPVRKGFQAALIGQMANLSLTLGRRIRWNDQLGKIEV
jgi:predicted dehydrogenase